MFKALEILARGGVTVTEAARLAGVNRASLYRAIKRPAEAAVAALPHDGGIEKVVLNWKRKKP